MATERKVRELLEVLSAVYGAPLSPPLVRAWVVAMRDLTDEALEQGVERTIREARYVPARSLPRPADVRELCGVTRPEDAAALAWGLVVRTAKAKGSRPSVDFDDRTINAAVRSLGGWAQFCALDEEEMQRFARAKFIASYAAFARSGVSAQAGAPLEGIEQRVNGTRWPEDVERLAIDAAGAARPVALADWRLPSGEGMRPVIEEGQPRTIKRLVASLVESEGDA